MLPTFFAPKKMTKPKHQLLHQLARAQIIKTANKLGKLKEVCTSKLFFTRLVTLTFFLVSAKKPKAKGVKGVRLSGQHFFVQFTKVSEQTKAKIVIKWPKPFYY